LIAGVSHRRTFETLRREGIKVRGPRLALTYAPLGADAQVAFAIPRKVGGAVVRNRSRRRIRAALDVRARSGRLRNGVYLVHVRTAIDDLDAPGLEHELDRVLLALESRVAG
jgi:ribonuclease P protein component